MKRVLFILLAVLISGAALYARGEGENAAAAGKEPTELVWYMFFDDQEDMDKVFSTANDYIAGQLNTTIDFRPMNYTTYSQKVPILFASGEQFDLLWMCDWIAGVTYQKFAQDGVLYPLDDVLTQYAPEVETSLPKKIWDLTKIGGKIYGIPNTQNFTRWRGMWVNKELADKYGFDPDEFTSYKDLEPFYDQVLANEKGITPFNTTSGTIAHMKDGHGPGPDYGVTKQLGSGFNAYMSEPRNFYHELIDEKYREGILANWSAMHEWYEKGYVRPDVLTVKDARAEIKAGKYASSICTLNFNSEANFLNENGYEAYFFPVATPELSGVTATLNCVSVTSKHAPEAMEFLNLMHTDEYIYNLLVYGLEGEHYQETGKNRVEQIKDSGYDGVSRSWTLGNTFLRYLRPGEPGDLHSKVKELNESAAPAFMADWSFDDSAVKNEKAAIDSLWEEYGKALSAGVYDPDEYADVYAEKMIKAGVEKIRDIMQAQFDAYWAAKDAE